MLEPKGVTDLEKKTGCSQKVRRLLGVTTSDCDGVGNRTHSQELNLSEFVVSCVPAHRTTLGFQQASFDLKIVCPDV